MKNRSAHINSGMSGVINIIAELFVQWFVGFQYIVAQITFSLCNTIR